MSLGFIAKGHELAGLSDRVRAALYAIVANVVLRYMLSFNNSICIL
jgi:hypothetical protein